MDIEAKKAVIDAHAKHEGDTGSPEVQVALKKLTSSMTFRAVTTAPSR